MSKSPVTAYVTWSSQFVEDLVRRALESLTRFTVNIQPNPFTDDFQADSERLPSTNEPVIQWSEYDSLSHSLTQRYPDRVISSSYAFRKGLIRKHFLHRTFVNYFAKHPDSALRVAVPKTWDIELAFADELDELWADDLWELGQLMGSHAAWFILKPGMADRGMGIRMFRTKEELGRIFEEFEEVEDRDSEAGEDGTDDDTAVAVSQLRHFVIQEYLPDPLLVDPLDARIAGHPPEPSKPSGRKFHLRAYCIASGALTLYLCPSILALFAPVPYTPPSEAGGAERFDLGPHLTNTCLQKDSDSTEDSVRLLSELVGCRVCSDGKEERRLSQTDVDQMVVQVADVLAETFRAAVENPVHFQPLPNAFELFGADLLVSIKGESTFQVHILELNAEPAIEMTGARLSWILNDLFDGIACACVGDSLEQRVNPEQEQKLWEVGETRYGLRKCLEMEVRGSRSW